MKLNFDNSFAKLNNKFYSKQLSRILANPSLVHFAPEVAELIGLNNPNSKDICHYFSGNEIDGQDALATVYSGHQFGQWAGQLGDGRALLLGEVVNENNQRWDIQLKGSGLTPYSRMGDGNAVLRSAIREHLCSEALANLGIATTRSLCVISSTETAQRKTTEPCAIQTRIAQSLIRFGHFEHFFYTNQHKQLKELACYTLNRHYPQQPHNEEGFYHLFEKVVVNTAKMIAQWQAVGFCHGVMNTDNMSIIGLTIDYGPFGFLDKFDSHHICNTSDYQGRYSYANQPAVAYWNLSALAQALSPLISEDKLKKALDKFEPTLQENYSSIMLKKLGFSNHSSKESSLINPLLDILEEQKIDYTIFFRTLSSCPNNDYSLILPLFSNHKKLTSWLQQYSSKLTQQNMSKNKRQKLMKKHNPKYILRNYLAQQAIKQAYKGHYKEVEKLYGILRTPFSSQPENESYASLPPKWAESIKNSCSS